MGWAEPSFTKGQIDRAGKTLVNPDASPTEVGEALAIANNWRSSHAYPLNTLQISLRRKASLISDDSLVAQRIKRLPSIQHKLERFPSMNLARMQDLGGCRAVMPAISDVRDLETQLLDSRHKHRLVRHDDYLDVPKSSGYRGIHMVYAYHSDKIETWNKLSIEVQIRSALQHSWATAVETVGLFTSQALKSSLGDTDWLRFFQVASSAIALREGAPAVPGTSTDASELRDELRSLTAELDVITKIQGYAAALRQTEEHVAGAKFVLLTLNVPENELTIRGFRTLEDATLAYSGTESLAAKGVDVVLVSVSTINGLRTAYPNYFLDTTRFAGVLKQATK